ncbi:MAG: TetR family transcriptional regulator C-terminal domain-containing protein [Acidobacteria bacterium]|nr:TetR family transcriptional regulator C-terminal domain-containing protein [Acidobacteriota bacterium]
MQHATKTKLIETGLEIMREKGFNNTGLSEVLSEAGVPKGSFYHFFKSKEDFGEQILEHYARANLAMTEATLTQAGVSPLQRMRAFFESAIDMCACNDYSGGCLIGNLTQELADQNPKMSGILERKWAQQRMLFQANLEEAQREGELSPALSPGDLADFLINAWQGAMMRMKLTHSDIPLRQFLAVTFTSLLR